MNYVKSDEAFFEFVEDVAAGLGDKWTARLDEYGRVDLLYDGSERLRVQTGDGYIRITGYYSYYTEFPPSTTGRHPEMTCTVSQGAKAAARDIARRLLLPVYWTLERELDQCKEG